MFEFLMKDNLPRFFKEQFIPSLNLSVFLLLLTYKKYSPVFVGFALGILMVYIYFVHRFLHALPSMINIHVNYHHNGIENNSNIITKYLNLSIEMLTNILVFVVFYYIQKIAFNNCIPGIIIFYYGFLSVTSHIINYSIFHASNTHLLHHTISEDVTKNKTCNYGPDMIDHLFSTTCNDEIENYNHLIPNTLMAFLITYYVYKPQLY